MNDTPKKQELFKTAFSPLFHRFVRIEKAYQDDRGEWIFACIGAHPGSSNWLFRETELTDFCL